MNIQYSKTAYVETSDAILDELGNLFNGWAAGDGTLCIAKEDLFDDALEDEPTDVTLHLINTLEQELEQDVANVVFHN